MNSLYLISPEDRLDDLSFNSMLLVLTTGMQLLNDIERFLSPFGLSHGRFSILLALAENSRGDLIAGRMAELFGKSKPTIARMISKLRQEGFIYAETDPSDRRASLLYLTEKALKLLAEIIPGYNSRIRRISSSLTEEDKKSLISILSGLELPEGGVPDEF